MKKLIITLAIVALTATACSAAGELPPTPENIAKANASPGNAVNFNPCPTSRPLYPESDQKGTIVTVFTKDGKWITYGTTMTPGEIWDAICTAGGGN